jgi:hypothetical protein
MKNASHYYDKYLDLNVTKLFQNLYAVKYKTSMKGINEDLNK